MRALRFVLLMGFAAVAHGELACPLRLDAGAKAGLTKQGWIIEKLAGAGALAHASLFNMDAKHEYELVPDSDRTVGADLVQQWKASDYRQLDLYIRCDYGAAGQMRIKVPVVLKTCEQKLITWDRKKQTAASVEMVCR
jgi:hypothetical protein